MRRKLRPDNHEDEMMNKFRDEPLSYLEHMAKSRVYESTTWKQELWRDIPPDQTQANISSSAKGIQPAVA